MSLRTIEIWVEVPDDLDLRREMIPGSGNGDDCCPPVIVRDYVLEDVAEAVDQALEQYGIVRVGMVDLRHPKPVSPEADTVNAW